ncbi:hypothetical protein [Zavarzinella formosa]|uniref:hypothetical protein n=1 Tax=Zavarzinella formosa TaxID=360055 RepID=UPI0003807B4B|nr:hypothetical protein [Zavarzinella formosa]
MAETTRRPKRDVPFASDAEVADMVGQFEQCRWPYERWTHRAHLAVALIYLQRFPAIEAEERTRHHIQLYNRTVGDASGYHETITLLFLRKVASYRLTHDKQATVAEAVEELARECHMQWPLRYYSPERLWSDEARAKWVEPDLQPLDF